MRINHGIYLMLLVSVFQVFFVLMVKISGEDSSTAITVLSYYIIPLIFLYPTIYKRGLKFLKTRQFVIHLIRGFFASVAVFCFFYAIRNIHLGVASVLFNATPVFIPFSALIFLNERTNKLVWFAILLSFIGVIIVTGWSISGIFSLDSLIALISGISMAIAQIMLRYLSKKTTAQEIVSYIYFSASLWSVLFIAIDMALFPGNVLYLDNNVSVYLSVFCLILLGISSYIAQKILTKAFYYLEPAKLVPVLYVAVPLSAFVGYLGWDESIGIAFWIGSMLVFIGIFIIAFEKYIPRGLKHE